jgi:hypothetical protein
LRSTRKSTIAGYARGDVEVSANPTIPPFRTYWVIADHEMPVKVEHQWPLSTLPIEVKLTPLAPPQGRF